MAVANFEELCAGLCEVAGLKLPALCADQRGMVGLHTTYRGIAVDVMHWPHLFPDRVYVVFEFGPLPEHAQSSRLYALLRANFLPFQEAQGVYACNPATGDVVLQFSFPLAQADPHTLMQLLEDGIARASRWKEATPEKA